MSRLSKKTIPVPPGVTVNEKSGVLVVAGPKGEIRLPVLPFITLEINGQELDVSGAGTSKQARMNTGTMWSLSRNAIQGVTEGFVKKLEIEGVGYRAALDGQYVVLSLGYVNPVRFAVPQGISVGVEKNVITVSGINKELVGWVASKLRGFKKPEPYKGKGIRYQGEVVRRKVGKKATATAS